MSSDGRYKGLLELRKVAGTFRSLKQHPTRPSTRDRSNTNLIDFSSNDYLSLTQSQSVRDRYLARLSAVPSSDTIFGSTGSRLLDGTSPAHTALEDRLATFFDSPSALLFSSGWDANVSFFSAVPQRGDYIVYDELVHASVWDGMRGGERRGVRAKERRPFKHNSLADLRIVLETIVRQITASKCTDTADVPMVFIALESLYSMDGDLAPLSDIVILLQSLSAEHPAIFSKANVWIVLDEAHTTGAYGRGGRGFVNAVTEDQLRLKESQGKGRADDVDFEREVADWVKVRVMTFGKAVGGQGAVLLSSPTIRSFLINYARPFIFSTAMSVSNILAIESAFDVLQSAEGDERRQRLREVSAHALKRVEQLLSDPQIGTELLALLPPSPSPFNSTPGRDATAILPLITPHPHSLADHIRAAGFLVRPIVHPTVPKGKERVRICLHAGNCEEDIDKLVGSIAVWAMGRLRDGARADSNGQIQARL